MSRIIKFRVWDANNKKWSLEREDGDVYSPIHTISFDGKARRQFYSGHTEMSDSEYVIQQFTGLTDRNDKEIYEGDILKNAIYGNRFRIAWAGEEENFIEYCGFVTVNLDNKIRNLFLSKNFVNCEIIGNIFETPQLLNQTNNKL